MAMARAKLPAGAKKAMTKEPAASPGPSQSAGSLGSS